MPRVEETEALAVISALEDVSSFEWLEPEPGQGVRTPDLRIELGTGRSVLVEVTLATSTETIQLLQSDKIEIKSDVLAYRWRVRVAHTHSKGGEPARPPRTRPLLPLLVPILSGIESQGGAPEATARLAEERLYQEMKVIDGDLDATSRRIVRVTEVLPVRDGEQGGIEAIATIGRGLMPEGVDDLVLAVQARIDEKHDHDQGADWLVVAIDRVDAGEQIHSAFSRGSESGIDGAPDLSAIDLRGFEEVWVFARSPSNGVSHIVLRFSGSGATWKRCLVELESQ